MKTLLLAQHCQSHHHVNRLARLWPDSKNGLTNLGIQQAEALAKRLHKKVGQEPCQVYCSPMQRTKETAEIIGREIVKPPRSVSGLHEYNGHFAMERSEDGEEWVVDNSNWSLFDWHPVPEAETWREFHARVCAAMDRLTQETDDTSIPILVVHGGTLSNIVVWWLGLSLDALPERTCFAASAGSLSILKKNSYSSPVIERLNDRAHLPRT